MTSNRLACRDCGREGPPDDFSRHGLKWRCPDCERLNVDLADTVDAQDGDPDG